MTTLADLLAEPEGADELWHIDAKDRDPASEEYRQRNFLGALAWLAPHVAVFAVPNGGKRSLWAAGKAKREGMRAGATDLVVTWAGGVAFLEWKNGVKMPGANQRDFLNRLYRQGHACGVFRRSDSALDFLRAHGAPVATERAL